MENQFEGDISRAKEFRRKKRLGVLIGLSCTIAALFFVYSYLNSFHLRVLPTDIDNYFVKIEEGVAFRIGSRILAPFGRTTFAVSARGFIDERRTVSKELVEKVIRIKMKYAPVAINLEPSDSITRPRWILDGIVFSSEERPTLKLKPGKYKLSFFSDYHVAPDTFVTVEPASPFNLAIKVSQKVSKYKFLSTPSGASIYLGNEKIGQTPIEGEMPAGLKNLRIEKDGYAVVNELIDTKDESELLIRNYKLNKTVKLIDISYRPEFGKIFVDGQQRNLSTTLKINSVGGTKIRYESAGYQGKEVVVDETNDSISFDLQPVFGELSLNAIPEAEAFIEGKSLGVSPLSLNLLAKRHEILLKAEGYVPHYVEVEILPNGTHRHTARLETWHDYRFSKSRPSITNSLGISMKRFLPEKMSIGAPRNQKGQRVNEQLRAVDFSRSIYFAKFEVTETQYAVFKRSFGNSARNTAQSSEAVTGVSWDDAALFCNWLSQREGLDPFYRTAGNKVIDSNEHSLGYRLPTEAEWEYIARFANKESPTVFVWGDEYKVPPEAGNLADISASALVKVYLGDYEDNFIKIAPVGSFGAELSGVYDMSGNVSEWVHDFYSLVIPDAKKVYMDYMGENLGFGHVVKGSNYLSAGWIELRASFKETSNEARTDVGFRIARFIN